MGQGSSSSPQTPAVTLNKDVPTTTRRRTIFQSVREDEFAPRRSRSMTLPIKLFEKQRKELVRTQSDLGAEATKETNVVVLSEDDDGNKMINNYTVLRPIGKGSYGKVKLCIDSNNKAFAVKIMEKSALKRVKKGESSALDDVMREIAILKKIRHENIVRLYEIINDPANDRLYLVMEFVENGSLKTDKPLPIEKCNKYMHDLIRGLEYLHSQNICHRDIKPENLLLSGLDVVKLSDFGVSHIYEGTDDTLKKTAGTPAFLAPEACTDEPYSGKAADIWAVGVTLYMMVYGTSPFIGDSFGEIYQSILNKELTFSDDTPEDLKDLLCRLLDKNPKTRITIDQIKKHPWMTKQAQIPQPKNIKVTTPEVENAVLEGTTKKMADQVVLVVSKPQNQSLEASNDHLLANQIKREHSTVISL